MKKLFRRLLSVINHADILLGEQRMRHSPARNLHNILWERAAQQSADFVEKYLGQCVVFDNKEKMWNYVGLLLNEKHNGGIVLEFGVAAGVSINWLSRLLPNFQFVGFDSFIGLKEDWAGHHATKGAYSQNGILPKVNSNVTLRAGWFDQTLPDFINQNDLNDLRLVHIDGDTYEAAVVVFNNVGSHLKPGILVLFDELIGYPNWQNGEIKALQEAQKRFGFSFRYRAFSSEQALIEITA